MQDCAAAHRETFMKATLWLNKSYSNTFNVVESLRQTQPHESLRVICTHTQKGFIAGAVADHSELEPSILRSADYLPFALDFCLKNQVDLFLPGKHTNGMARHRARFEQQGTRLMVAASSATLDLMESKEKQYQACPPDFPLPKWRCCRTLEEFDLAHAELAATGATVCIKPTVSVYGLGFKILVGAGGRQHRLFSGDSTHIGLDDCRRALGEKPTFRGLMVMELLPGPERSVDCLGHEGRLVWGVVRRKSNGAEPGQWIEDHPAILEWCARLTEHFKLTGLYNIQFKEDSLGNPLLLEINPRMSGGLAMACMAGVNFPLWAARLAMGSATPKDVPQPRTGFRVCMANRAVML
jgi:biotin carboxylase